MTILGDDWVPDAEGIPFRRAARVVLFDGAGNVLLLKGHDGDDASHEWWFTVGGGLEAGEAPRDGAVRELFEETGLQVDPDELQGPVLERSARFQFFNVLARQDEQFFISHTTAIRPNLVPKGLTNIEQEVLDGGKWFTPEEIIEVERHENVYPAGLGQMIAQWSKGWDGTLIRLDEGEDRPK